MQRTPGASLPGRKSIPSVPESHWGAQGRLKSWQLCCRPRLRTRRDSRRPKRWRDRPLNWPSRLPQNVVGAGVAASESELEQWHSPAKGSTCKFGGRPPRGRQADPLNSLMSVADELRLIQSALCARVRELTNQTTWRRSGLCKMDDQCQARAQAIQARERETGSFRHTSWRWHEPDQDQPRAPSGRVSGSRRMETLDGPPSPHALSMAQAGVVSE